MFANCQRGGMDIAFPDICKTPPALLPIPYPDFATGLMGIPNAWNILLQGGPAHNLLTTIPLSNGDNPGVALGLISQTVMSRSRSITCVPNVLWKGIPATRLTSLSMQNTVNTVGMRVVPSQFKVLLLGGGGAGGGAGKGGKGVSGSGPDAARKAAAREAKRAQLKRNRRRGAQREREVEAELKQEGHEVMGTQVSAKTPLTRRVIDILIKDKNTGKIRAVEVKSGGARRSATQKAKDKAMENKGAELIGKNAPKQPLPKNIRIPTEVRH